MCWSACDVGDGYIVRPTELRAHDRGRRLAHRQHRLRREEQLRRDRQPTVLVVYSRSSDFTEHWLCLAWRLEWVKLEVVQKPVWLSGNALVSIVLVTLRQARLLPGWVTALGRVNHLGAEPGTQVYSAIHGQAVWVPSKSLESKQAHCVITRRSGARQTCGWMFHFTRRRWTRRSLQPEGGRHSCSDWRLAAAWRSCDRCHVNGRLPAGDRGWRPARYHGVVVVVRSKAINHLHRRWSEWVPSGGRVYSHLSWEHVVLWRQH